ncbi:MAG: hypothetical protein WCD26_02530 [Pseudolabrys sp.]
MKRSVLLLMAALVVVGGTPVFAKSHHSSAKTHHLGYAYEPGRDHASTSRSEAIQKCNAEAAKWRYSDWQSAQITNYRDCMTGHGQQFE